MKYAVYSFFCLLTIACARETVGLPDAVAHELLPTDVDRYASASLVSAGQRIAEEVDELLEENSLAEIETWAGDFLRRTAIDGLPGEKIWANLFLQELASRIRHEFPELPSADPDDFSYTVGMALIQAGKHETGVQTLFLEARLLDADAMITLADAYEDGIEDEDGNAILKRYDPRILDYFREMAGIGLNYAEFVLGRFTLQGIGIPVDEERGIQLLQASESGLGMMILGTLYCEKGNYEAAGEWWRKAAEQDDLPGAWHNMAVLAMENDRFDAALDYLKRALAADPSYSRSKIELGRLYIEGWGVKQNLDKSAELMTSVLKNEEYDMEARALAEYHLGLIARLRKQPAREQQRQLFADTREKAIAGDAEAMYRLGRMYAEGMGSGADYDEALIWWRKAADAGNAGAMWCLGAAYGDGLGVPRDTEKAVGWYRKAAAAGSPEAMCNLGNAFNHGEGVERNGEKAEYWYRKAIQAGYTDAMFYLGAMYTDGVAVPRDYRKCVTWYRKAAAAGNTEAMVYLGLRYAEGEGVPRDNAKAVEWYEKAARKGHPHAMILLAQCCQEGIGVEKNLGDAYIWLSAAVRSGVVEVYEVRDEIARKLSPDERRQADMRMAGILDMLGLM